MTTSQILNKISSMPAVDQRATPRLKPEGLVVSVTNITTGRKQETEPALLVDVSLGGMRIETTLAVSPGDALRIELTDSTLLAEALYCTRTANRSSLVGLKLFHSLKHADLRKCVVPEIWNSFL